MLNPKGIVFFVAFLPQFIDSKLATTPQLLIITITFVLLGAINAATYALLANRLSRLLNANNTRRKLSIVSGSLLTIAGAWTLTLEQS